MNSRLPRTEPKGRFQLTEAGLLHEEDSQQGSDKTEQCDNLKTDDPTELLSRFLAQKPHFVAQFRS